MRTALLVMALGVLTYIAYLLLFHFTLPRTYIGDTDLSFIPLRHLPAEISDLYTNSLLLKIDDRVYTYSYHDLGILLDVDQVLHEEHAFRKNPLNVLSMLYDRISNPKQYEMPLIFTESYYSFIEETIIDFSQDENTNRQEINTKNAYRIDGENLRRQLLATAYTGEPLDVSLVPLNHVLGASSNAHDARMRYTTETPISVVIESSPLQTVLITADELKDILLIEKTPDGYTVEVDKASFEKLVAQKNQFIKHTDTGLSADELHTQLSSVISQRMRGIPVESIIATLSELPNTDGSEAEKYLEVDISQQKMYLFEGGINTKTLRISSGLYYPTPIGKFTIMNKAKNAFSDIYNVYMPYWMAFYYGPDVQAYFGIHELPYWVAQDGTRHQRPREFIGQPRTGGCVALDVGDAQRVYEFAEVGMPVLIFE